MRRYQVFHSSLACVNTGLETKRSSSLICWISNSSVKDSRARPPALAVYLINTVCPMQ
ncbi:hypothetical protein [Pseudomonas sp. 37 R 15]|nr:hypothetical protein [Pseudomonas sp. 37 R 15]CRM44716.1 hypothetical protein [Pseudomonas sp. 37 R 15]